MNKKLSIIIVISIIVCSAVFVNNANCDSIAVPSKLKIFIGPASVSADNSTYNCVFVQLQDSNSKPARALEDTIISLSSSSTNIGTVDSSIIIAKGQTYSAANFNSTFSPGTTTISAAATGYATVQGSITTIGPIPAAVAVYGSPSTLPADGNSYDSIIVQLQDSAGSPAKAPKQGVQVVLSSSNTNVGNVTPSVTILEGQTYVKATFTTDMSVRGSAIISTLSQGYTSKQVIITTMAIASNPTQLKIFTGPSQVLADQTSYRQVAVQLQNSTGFPCVASSDVAVDLGSSDQTVGTVDAQITIPQGHTYALATLNTTYKAGSTTITALGTNLLRSQLAISTIGFIPSKLAVYCVPSTLPSDNATYQAIQVQLQDSQGRPAKDPQANVTVSLFSSLPTIATTNSTLTIPFGATQATGNLTVTNSPGTTTITAQAPGYTTGQGTVVTYLIDLAPIQITANVDSGYIYNGAKTNITTYLTSNGSPLTGATIQLTSDNGGTFSSTTAQGNGYYKTVFTAPSFTKTTTCTITVTASKTALLNAQTTVQVTVQLPPVAPLNTTSISDTTSTANVTGTIRLLVQDSSGNPISDVNVSSIVQPEGVDMLSGITNDTGYVAFTNITTGNYSLSLVKDGYEQTCRNVTYKDKPLSMTMTLESNVSAPGNNNALIIALVIIIIVIVALLIGVKIIKRRKAAKMSF